MTGRLEHEIRNKELIQEILKELPDYVTGYYYFIQTSTESTTCIDYLYKIRLFLVHINFDLNKINEIEIGKYLEIKSYKVDQNGNKSKISKGYYKGIVNVLRSFVYYLYDNHYIISNPMKNIKVKKGTDEITRRSVSVNDVNKMLTVILNSDFELKERDYLIVYLLMYTGMRKTALSEINISDINFDEGNLKVIDKRDKTHEYILTSDAKEIIKLWIKKRNEIFHDENNDALFISKKNNRISQRALFDVIQKYSELALGYKLHPHDLRSGFITSYYEQSGFNIDATRKAVGHSNVATTARYIRSKNNERELAANFMSNSLNKI